MIAAKNKMLELLRENKSGNPRGITSVCSANEFVIRAAIINARRNNQPALIESTSNQVDQFGGYTGITPSGFRELVYNIAMDCKFPSENIILGGDHLGPNRWQDESSTSAMQKAKEQIAAYVSAGYTKIHLDASMKCADDGSPDIPLDASIISERAAILCKTAEETYENMNSNSEPPVYIIGTDVPPPGGAFTGHDDIHVTSEENVEETIELTRTIFMKNNLDEAWKRVTAVVVQPGVEFGDINVFDYNRSKAQGLIKLIAQNDSLVYEAHSTDYQKKEYLRHMVRDHFAILKVGPWLTYAFREAVFAIANIEQEFLSGRKDVVLSNIINTIEERMNANPKYWLKYYSGSEEEKKFKRKYSYSDRIRYYWSDTTINEALNRLINNLKKNPIPLTLISQYLPEEYYAIRDGQIQTEPEELILHKILNVFNIYNYAAYGGAD